LLVADGRLAESSVRKTSGACFDQPERFDLIVDHQKVAGAAQRRTAQGLLHQGSINHPAAMTGDFATRLAAVLAPCLFEEPISDELLAAARVLETTKYGTDAWLRRFGAKASRAKESLAQ
jgi:lipoate-protein ligase A